MVMVVATSKSGGNGLKITDLKCAVIGGSPVVRITTDEGIDGLGQAEWAKPYLKPHVLFYRDYILGEDPTNVERVMSKIRRMGSFKPWGASVSAIEVALWDIAGKAAGLPIHKLLGGACRDRINHFGFLQGDDPEKLAEHAADLVGNGFSVLYLKVGRGRERDVACIKAIRERVGYDVRFRVDANMAWQVGEAIQELNALAEYDIDFAEQPVDWQDLDGLARLRESVPIPIAVDQGCFTDKEAMQVVQKGAADVIVAGLHETGGVLGMKRLASVANAGGLPVCRHGVMGETGISTLTAL